MVCWLFGSSSLREWWHSVDGGDILDRKGKICNAGPDTANITCTGHVIPDVSVLMMSVTCSFGSFRI